MTPNQIYCANSGDSRAVLKSGKRAIALSSDHKPYDKAELRRIKKAGHTVDMQRVDGDLALSRAFGDFNYKDKPKLKPQQQAVTCFPDILVRKRSNKD